MMHISGWLYLLEQTAAGFCLLTAVGLCAGCRLSRPHLLLASLAASLSSTAAAAAPLLLRAGMLLAVSICAPLIAFPGLPVRLRPKVMLCSLLLCATAAGFQRLMHPLPLPGALILLILCGLIRALPVVAPKAQEPPHLATVDVRCGTHHVALTALIDSGNLLRDAVTGLPVIVISRRTASRLVHLPAEGSLPSGMRLLPVRTITGMSLMPVFRPDCVCLLIRGRWQNVPAIIGISPDGYDGFQALVPSCVLPAESAAFQSQC